MGNLGDVAGKMFQQASKAVEKAKSEIDKSTSNKSSDEEKIEFIKPINPLDPIVIFDPEFEFSNIVFPYDSSDENIIGESGDDINILNVNGIMVPILKLNNKVIFPKNIYSLIIYIKDFLPTISLTINDEDKNIQATDVPGMNNIITVILTAPVDGANKKMSMDFYITDCIFNDDDTITYKGEFKFNELNQVKYTQVGSEQLSTYELLENIAKELKLGFAASEKCKDINDKHWRQIYSETYVNYIKQELTYGGEDEDSIFDAWIDNFGYLVMVNLSYIMNTNIDPKQLSIKVVEGTTLTLPDDKIMPQNVDEVYRVITNSQESLGKHNLYFEEYHSIVNNNFIKNKGTANRYYYLTLPGEDNTVDIQNLEVVENSADGIKGKDEYKYENIEFIGTLQSDDENEICKIFQKEIVENFFNKMNSKILKVVLENANYSLQRGMLVTVIVEEYDIGNKQFLQNNIENPLSPGEDEENHETPPLDREAKSNLSNDSVGFANIGLSGIYYIKEMEFGYFHDENKISQTLYLVKKGYKSNLTNKYTNIKLFDGK